MLGDPGDSSGGTGKERKADTAPGSSKEIFPSLVVSRGRSEPRSKGGKKKEDRRSGFSDDRGFEEGSSGGRRGGGRRGPRKERDEFGGRGRYGKDATKYEGTREFNNRSEFGQTFVGLPEDSRISTILRKLTREEDERKFTVLIKNLQDALALADNAAYIRRSLDMILDSLYDVLCNGPNQQCKVLAARSLGHVGFALDKESKKFIDWIYNKYKTETKENAKKLLTTGIQELVLLDANHQKLSEHSQLLMKCVGEIMETTECGDIFITAVELTLSLIHRYPELLPTHFHDTVDVLLGWHFEPSQPKSVTECAGKALTILAPYWVQDLQFTYSLLNDFLEDIFTTSEQIVSDKPEESEKPSDKEEEEDAVSNKTEFHQHEEIIHRITSILNVVASVMKNLEKHLSPVIPPPLSIEFLNECLEKIMKNVTETSELVTDFCYRLITAGNKCAKYIVSILGNRVRKADVLLEFLYMQFRLVGSSAVFNSTHFGLIAKIVECVDEAVTTGFVDVLLCPDSVVLKGRLDDSSEKIELIYESLLRNKNVHVLIRSYAHIIGDLDAALRSIKADLPPFKEFGEDNPHLHTVYPESQVQEVILFILRAFKELAIDSNPSTPLIALKPTLFDVLTQRMPLVVDPCAHPRLHLAYMRLLRAHCIAHNYFTEAVHLMEFAASQTQTLAEALGVSTVIDPPSLSKKHYPSTVIELLNFNLTQRLETLNKIMIVEWTHEILILNLEKGESFEKSHELQELIGSLCFAAADSRPKIALACVPVLKYIAFNNLIATTHFFEQNALIIRLIDLCFYYLNSADDKVRQEFHLLMSALPAVVLTFVTKNQSFMAHCSVVQLISINYEDMISTQGVVDSTVFRDFMNYIFHGVTPSLSPFKWMTDLMSRNYNLVDTNHEHGIEVRNSLGCIMEWLAFQAAKHCIDNRLRTVYGKALGTFTAIEDTIRFLAKETISKKNLTDTPATCRRARLLIQFVEQFEKLLYNAVEGTGSAFHPASKQSKTFFATNRASCLEWFHRIRLALLVVALHSGMSPWAVRHGYCLLQNLVDSKATHSPEFEAALLNTGLALTGMGERDAVTGLHLWARDIAQSSHSELKPLIDMASRSYESAADKFEDMIADIGASNVVTRSKQNGIADKTKNMAYTVKSFLADQLTECYLALNSWDELSSWKKREAEFLANDNGECCRKYGYVTANFAEAMSKFDAGDLNGAAELLVWDEEETESLFPSDRPSWDVANLLDEADFILKNIIVNKCCNSYYTLKALSKCGNAQTLAENCMEDIIKDSSSEILSKACSLKFVAHAMINRGSNLAPEPYVREAWWRLYVSSPDMERCTWWAIALEKSKKPVASNESLKVFLIEVIKASRKAGNLRYTTKCLLNYLDRPSNTDLCLGDLAEEFLQIPVEPSQAPALHQLTKLLRSTCDTATSVRLSTHISAGLLPLEDEHYRMLNSAVLRNLSTIFAAEKGHFENLVSDQLNEVLSLGIKNVSDTNLQAFMALCDQQQTESVVQLPKEDTIVGKILLASVGAHINSLKSWEALAAWCYEMGGKVCSQIWVKNPDNYGGLETLKVISSYHSVGVDVDRASSESLEDQIRDLGIHTLEQINSCIAAWKVDNARVYSFFKMAIHSYFKFLKISPYEENNCKFVTATLRLLRLMVKHASELQETVDADLADTPVHPWIPIVPQLLARLNHADPYVRKKVEELLVKIGLEAPHLILFPAVVGSGAMPTTKLFPMMKTYENKKDVQTTEDCDDDIEDEDEDDRDDDDEMRSTNERAEMMENSFHSILDSLSEKYEEEISQVKMFVSELQRITLLWDELWLGALLQHQGDINRRFSSLQSEIKTTEANNHLEQATKDAIIKDKYRLILKPILFIFEQLHEITSVEPETAREKQFQELYTETIQTILKKLREPTEPCNPNEVWEIIQGLQHALQDKSRYRGGVNLSMSDLSTTLSKLDSTKIFMPGVKGRRMPPTIDKVENNVIILPTKTKPKKLIFCGSDGENYTYLFKGLEDLHLDERIMQFLSIANSMLKEPHLQAHHYSVVPLGPRSGLISWVENVTPIFSLYKKWQQREASKSPDDISRSVMRPSELFATKLGPILMEHNIPTVDQNQRHKWPVAALRKCLQELMSITPTYLLYKELWAHSVNASHWWRTLKIYSSSLAVMSMIGYIIGLGDRHLDNVLVNLKTGEVVHIDYNVCFEKGKTLRVPEKVPFRLTPNLRAALGVTGVEGVYKQTCEHVLQVMREGQETLLTLLEAFVYDPLIDWTPFSEGGYTGAVYGGGRELTSGIKVNKKELMKEVACSMFKVRITESKYQWMENKKTLSSELEDLARLINAYIEREKKKQRVQDLVKERHSQLALLKEAEGQPKHSLYSLHTRYSHYIQVYTAKEAVMQKLNGKIKDCESVNSQYSVVMQKLKGTDLSNWIVEVGGRPKKDVCQVFDLIKEFLSNAGQLQTVQQCIYSEKEVGELCLQQTTLTFQLLEMLRDYYEICRHYPRSCLMSHRTRLYHRWSEKLLDDMSPSSCDEVLNNINKELSVSEENIMQVSMFSAGLERHLADTTIRLQKCMERSSETSRVNVNPIEVPAGWLGKANWVEEGRGDSTNMDKGAKALSAVVLTALCALNKKYIMIESQAMSAGDSLLNLTSQAGDWFLHDMCSVAGNILRLTQLLPQSVLSAGCSSEDPLLSQIYCAVKCMNHTYNQIKDLQEMYNNFIGIILVEAAQDQVCEEPSVVSLVDRLESIVSAVKIPIADILKSLQLHLRYTVMNMAVGKQDGSVKKSPTYLQNPAKHGAVMQVVETLQAGFEALLAAPQNNEGDFFPPKTPDQGEMLLMGFNGLFNLEIPRNGMVHHLKQLATPPAWTIVDQIKDPQKYYARPMTDDNARKILDAMFFVKKLSTMVEVLRMCRHDASGFRGGSAKAPQVPHDFESLTKPMRKYIADYISTQILGIFSVSTALFVCRLLEFHGIDVTGEVQQKDIGAQGQGNAPLEELCKKMAEIRTPELRTASGVVSQIEASWRQEDAQGRVARDLSNTQILTQHLKVMLTAHHWLHDHLLVNTNHNKFHIISRPSFLMEMRKAVSAMLNLQPRLKEAIEQQQALIISAEQRLKWAAGANPALCEVMSAFESAVSSHKMKLNNEGIMAKNVCNMATSILTHEALRTPTSEAIMNDNNFIALVNECRQFYELSVKKPVTLSPAEQGLVALKPPKKKIDADWVSRTEELISASLLELKLESEPLGVELMAAEQRMQQKVGFIKMTMAKHNHIIPDIKSLLKTLVKCDDSGLVGLDQYMLRYWKFVDTVNNLIKNLSISNHGTMDTAFLTRTLQDINELIHSTESIYTELLRFSTDDEQSCKKSAVRQGAGMDSPKKGNPAISKRDGGMVKNAYAIGVWRKVKFKLEGRDPDPGIKNTVKHQVNWAIAEATNLDNLALLYEGWTPWV